MEELEERIKRELTERINKIREYKGLTGKALAIEIDMKYSTMNNYLNGKQKPTAEFICRILSKYLDISAEWLMRGEGTMLRKESQEKQLIKELADIKVKLLVSEGITKKLTEIVQGRMNEPVDGEIKSNVG